MSKCKCKLKEVNGTDIISWYWQEHSAALCTVELPNLRCWCGLLRSEHVEGHNPEVVHRETYDFACETIQELREREYDND